MILRSSLQPDPRGAGLPRAGGAGRGGSRRAGPGWPPPAPALPLPQPQGLPCAFGHKQRQGDVSWQLSGGGGPGPDPSPGRRAGGLHGRRPCCPELAVPPGEGGSSVFCREGPSPPFYARALPGGHEGPPEPSLRCGLPRAPRSGGVTGVSSCSAEEEVLQLQCHHARDLPVPRPGEPGPCAAPLPPCSRAPAEAGGMWPHSRGPEPGTATRLRRLMRSGERGRRGSGGYDARGPARTALSTFQQPSHGRPRGKEIAILAPDGELDEAGGGGTEAPFLERLQARPRRLIPTTPGEPGLSCALYTSCLLRRVFF